jgi:O-antigen/teichoic acid export membrane protein
LKRRSSASSAAAALGRPASSREFLWIVLAQAVVVGTTLAALKFLTNLLSPASYGEFALAMTLAAAMSTLIYGPLSQVGLRFASMATMHGRTDELLDWLQATYWRVVLATSCIALAGGALLASRGEWRWALLGFLASCAGFAIGAIAVVVAVLNGLRLRRPMAIVQMLDALARPLIVVLAVATIARSSEVALAAAAIAAAVVLLVSYLPCRRLVLGMGGHATSALGTQGGETLRREVTGYLKPFVVFGAASLIGLYGDRWVIQTIMGPEEVGVYAVMYQIASAPVIILLGLVNQFAYPIVFARQESADAPAGVTRKDGSYRQVLVASAVVIGLLCAGAYVFGEAVLLLLAARSFAHQHQILWILVVGVSVFHFAQQMTLLGFSARRPSVYIWPKLVHSLLLLALAFLLGGPLGMQGVALAFVVASIIYLGLVAYVNRRLAPPAAS